MRHTNLQSSTMTAAIWCHNSLKQLSDLPDRHYHVEDSTATKVRTDWTRSICGGKDSVECANVNGTICITDLQGVSSLQQQSLAKRKPGN